MSIRSQENLKSRVLSGLRWSAVAKGVDVTFSFIVSIVLARLLLPDDFGLIAMAGVFTGVSNIILQFGTGSSIIQRQEKDTFFESSIFWFNVMTGLAIMMVAVLIAPLIARLYDEAIVKTIIYFQSINIILTSVGIVPQAVLEREINYYPLTVTKFVSQIVGSTAGIGMAYLGFGVWSLVSHSLITNVSYIVLLWIFSPFSLKFNFRKENINQIFGFSSSITATKLLNYFQRQGDNFVIGIMLGSTALGYYSKAYSFLLAPIKYISGFVSPVSFSMMSKLNKIDIKRLKNFFLVNIQAHAMVYFPIAVLIYIWSDHLIPLILGDQWNPIIPLVKIFSIIIVYQSLDNQNPVALKSLGRPDVSLKIVAITTPIYLIGFVIGAKFGIIGVGIAYAIVTFWKYVARVVITLNIIDISLSEYISAILSVILYFLLFSIALYFAKAIFLPRFLENNLLLLFISSLFGVFVYVISFLIKPLSAFTHLISFLGFKNKLSFQ